MAKNQEERKYVLVFRSGKRRDVTGEEGRYWVCGKTRFRKGSPEILRVEEKAAKKPEGAAEKKKERKKEEA